MKFEWEVIFHNEENPSYGDGGARTIRCVVPGGWIVDHLVWNDTSEVQSQSSVFVPDPNHEWEVNSNKEDILSKFLSDFESTFYLNRRTINILNCENIFTVNDLMKYREDDLLKITNLGNKTLLEIRSFKNKMGLHDSQWNTDEICRPVFDSDKVSK